MLYQKPSSTRSSTQSEQTPSHGKYSNSPARHPDFDGNTYRKPKLMDKWRQQEVHDDEDKKVLVGQNYLVDSDKWNDNHFIKFDRQQRRGQHNGNSQEAEDMKYRTFSKRSFRPDFVDPTDIRSLVWFVDADNPKSDEPRREYSGPPVRLFNRKAAVTRGDTFRVNSEEESRNQMDISNRHSLNEPIRVEIKPQAAGSDAGVKVVPVGNNRTPDRGSPPPPYSSRTAHKSPQRTFSTSTVMIGGTDGNRRIINDYAENTTRMRTNGSEMNGRRSGGFEDVMNAVRAPNSYRQFTGSHISLNPFSISNGGGEKSTQKQFFVSTVKVKPHRPAWR